MILMSIYGQLIVKEGQRDNIRHVENLEKGETNVERFRCTKVIYDHFQFHGAIDYRNKNRMYGDGSHGMSLETTWRNISW